MHSLFLSTGKEGPVISSCGLTNPCPANEECVSTGSTDQCVCRRGYARDKDGEACRDVNECTSLSASPCGMSALCTNIEGGFVCGCPGGFTGNPYTVCYPDSKLSFFLEWIILIREAHRLSLDFIEFSINLVLRSL